VEICRRIFAAAYCPSHIAVVFAVAFLVVIPEGDLLLSLTRRKSFNTKRRRRSNGVQSNMFHSVSLAVQIQPSQKPVKPPNHENPRQSSTFAWRMSYAPFATIDTEQRKAPAPTGAFSLERSNNP
jgi:hypothetical protein